jgi:hypothetical protein
MSTHAGEVEVEQDDIWAGGNPRLLVGAFPMQIRQGFIPIADDAQIVGETSLLEGALREAHIPGIIFNQQYG